MANANIEVLEEVKLGEEGEFRLCLHWARYDYTDGSESEYGYRFMWEDDEERKQTHLGQARIPSASDMLALIEKAAKAGWFVKCESEPR